MRVPGTPAQRRDQVVTDGPMDFSEALRRLKDGERIARSGWNGRGMYVFMEPPASPDRAPSITMKTAQGYLVPWLASQTDILSSDWEVVQ